MSDTTVSLTDKRKAETELAIAQAATELCFEQDFTRVTAADISRRAGVSPRTFYRYFSTKEDAIGPLLSAGADQWQLLVASSAVAKSDPLDTIENAIRAVLDPESSVESDSEQMRQLLRAVTRNPSLAVVWNRVTGDSEAQLRAVLAEVVIPDEDSLTIRIVAAAATAAIRIAFESWAETNASAKGPDGPAALAVRCFRTLSSGVLSN
jgi:AcrR family transcriptional regulator